MRKRFQGQFDALSKHPDYCNNERFHPLHREGKPLWEFKEHDHRLYCFRDIIPPNFLLIVLFNGWVKQGKKEREGREIQRAIDLYNEFLSEGGMA